MNKPADESRSDPDQKPVTRGDVKRAFGLFQLSVVASLVPLGLCFGLLKLGVMSDRTFGLLIVPSMFVGPLAIAVYIWATKRYWA